MKKFKKIECGDENGKVRVIKQVEQTTKSRTKRWLVECLICSRQFGVDTTDYNRGGGCIKCSSSFKNHDYDDLYREFDITSKDIHRLSSIYTKMLQRLEIDPGYKHLNISLEWKDSRKSFIKWSFENGYKNNLSLDRIDNSKGYFPDNCRWVSLSMQVFNRKCTSKHPLIKFTKAKTFSVRITNNKLFPKGYLRTHKTIEAAIEDLLEQIKDKEEMKHIVEYYKNDYIYE